MSSGLDWRAPGSDRTPVKPSWSPTDQRSAVGADPFRATPAASGQGPVQAPINERVSLRPRPALAMPPHLGAWAVRADIAAIPPSLAIAVRQFLGRAAQLAPPVRDRVGRELYAAVMRHVSPPPPPTHHEWVLVDRRRRDAERLAREDARRARVLPVDRLA
jgi:hypothetical protein